MSLLLLPLLCLVIATLAVRTSRLETGVCLLFTTLLLPSLNAALSFPGDESLRWGVLAVLMLVAGATAVMVRRPHAQGRRDMSLMWLAGLALCSVAWSIDVQTSLESSVAFLATIVFSLTLSRGGFGGAQLLRVLVTMAIIVALANLIGLVGGLAAPSGRYAGVFENPNFLGVLNALLFSPALAFALRARSPRTRFTYGSVAGLLVVESFLAGSRAGILSMALAYLFLVRPTKRWRGNRRRIAIALVPVLAAVFVSSSTVNPHRFSRENTRSELWGATRVLFPERPILGHGFGTTELTLVPFSNEGVAINFHNSYLNLVNDLGVLGVLGFVIVLIRLWQARRRADPAFVALTVSGLVSAAFESWLMAVGSGVAVIYWLTVAATIRGREVTSAPESLHVPLTAPAITRS